MNYILIPVALVLAYCLGYYSIFLGGPALFSKGFPRGATHLVTYAERKFPRHRGMAALQLLIATRLGILGCIGTTVLIVAGLVTK